MHATSNVQYYVAEHELTSTDDVLNAEPKAGFLVSK